MLLKASAKINLSLDVTGKRDDGYHEVRMIMQSIGLADEIEIRPIPEPEIRLSVSEPDLPADRSNLAWRAAEQLIRKCGIGGGVEIGLTKNIPMAAGLAGGSTDAAAVLEGMNLIYHLNLSDQELAETGASLGADIPFCLLGGTALAEGIGEKLTALPELPDCTILLAVPDAEVSTPEIYKALDAEGIRVHPDTDAMLGDLRRGDLTRLAGRMENVLEPVTALRVPEIGIIRQTMLEGGAAGARMSGSGPSVFGIFTDREASVRTAQLLRQRSGIRVYLTEPVGGRSRP